MNRQAYLIASATIFVLVTILHFVRIVNHWTVQIGALSFPFWGSWLAVIIGCALSIWAVNLVSEWRASRQ